MTSLQWNGCKYSNLPSISYFLFVILIWSQFNGLSMKNPQRKLLEVYLEGYKECSYCVKKEIHHSQTLLAELLALQYIKPV